MMRAIAMAALACWANAAAAEDARPRITVVGSATVATVPDLATIDYRIVGEGATSDAAVTALVAKRQRIDAGLAALAKPVEPRASDVAVRGVRGPACRRDDDDDQPRLSTGACVVIGYVASLSFSARTRATADVGTIVGLLARLAADNPHLAGFALADPQAAERRAIAAALVDARRRAEAIAAGTGATLGRLIVASTGQERQMDAQDIVVTGARVNAAGMPPPIVVDLTPQPVETRAQVQVSYEIAG